jgi:hypothetical protein
VTTPAEGPRSGAAAAPNRNVRPTHADREIVGAERDRETDQEHAGSQRAHGLAGEGVIKNEPQRVPLFGIGRRRQAGIGSRCRGSGLA